MHLESDQRLGCGPVELKHRCHRCFHVGRCRGSSLQSGCNHTRSNRLGKEQNVSWLRANVPPVTPWVDNAGDGVAELHFIIGDAVASQHGAGRLPHFVCSALHDGEQYVGLTITRKADNRKRRNRLSAHRIDITECVRSRYGPVSVWIVNNRRKEIDSLDQGAILRKLVDASIIRRFKANKDSRISPRLEARKHVIQKLWIEL